MWLIVFFACLIPLIVGLFLPRIRPWAIYLVLAFGFLIALIPIHAAINRTYFPGQSASEGEGYVRVTQNRLQRLTGPFAWRFLEWGMIEGDGANTSFGLWLADNFRIGLRRAQKYDVTNPTPFHLFLWLLLLSPISYLVCRKREHITLSEIFTFRWNIPGKRSNPHENQAKLGVLLAGFGLLSVAALTTTMFWDFDFQEFVARYKLPSLRFCAIVGSELIGLVCGGIGSCVSLNSAGQKDNKLSSLAWEAFFANAIVLLVTLCVGVIVFVTETRS